MSDEQTPKKSLLPMVLVLALVIAGVYAFFAWSKSQTSKEMVMQRVTQSWSALQSSVTELEESGGKCVEDYKKLRAEAQRLESANIPDSELVKEARNTIGPILKQMKSDLEKADTAYRKTEQALTTFLESVKEVKAHPDLYKKYESDLKQMEELAVEYQREMPRVKDILQQLKKIRADVQNLLDSGGTAQSPGNPQLRSASLVNMLKTAEARLLK